MDDDFNTGGAVGVLYELLTASTASPTTAAGRASTAMPKRSARVSSRAWSCCKELSQILGLFCEAAAEAGERATISSSTA